GRGHARGEGAEGERQFAELSHRLGPPAETSLSTAAAIPRTGEDVQRAFGPGKASYIIWGTLCRRDKRKAEQACHSSSTSDPPDRMEPRPSRRKIRPPCWRRSSRFNASNWACCGP